MKRWPYWKTLQGYYALEHCAQMMGAKSETLNAFAELWYQLAMAHERLERQVAV